MNSSIIYCTRPAHIIIKSSDNITIGSVRFDECGIPLIEAPFAALVIYNCSNIELVDSLFVCLYQQCGLVVANAVYMSDVGKLKMFLSSLYRLQN